MNTHRIAAAFLIAAFAFPAQATVLYKSVDANGVVMFSDTPPPSGARVVELREIGQPAEPGFSQPAPFADPMANESMLNADAILAAANAKLDQAERALAEARRARGPINGPLRLTAVRLTMEEDQRIEELKKEVRMARQRLLEVVRDRRVALARH